MGNTRCKLVRTGANNTCETSEGGLCSTPVVTVVYDGVVEQMSRKSTEHAAEDSFERPKSVNMQCRSLNTTLSGFKSRYLFVFTCDCGVRHFSEKDIHIGMFRHPKIIRYYK